MEPAADGPARGDTIATALVDEVVAWAVAAVRDLPPGRRLLLGLAGGPGAGKSTVVDPVRRRLVDSGVGCVVLEMDGYHLARARLDALPDPEEAHARRGAAFTFDAVRFVADLAAAKHGATVVAPTFDHAVGDPVEGGVVVDEGATVVLTEGLWLLRDEPPWDEVADLLDRCWFLAIDEATARERLLRRHAAAWPDREPAEIAAHVERSDLRNLREVAATAARADVVVPAPGT